LIDEIGQFYDRYEWTDLQTALHVIAVSL